MATLSSFMIRCAAILLIPASARAVRLPPKPVTPVISNGVRYSAEGDGVDQYVSAVDVASCNVIVESEGLPQQHLVMVGGRCTVGLHHQPETLGRLPSCRFRGTVALLCGPHHETGKAVVRRHLRPSFLGSPLLPCALRPTRRMMEYFRSFGTRPVRGSMFHSPAKSPGSWP